MTQQTLTEMLQHCVTQDGKGIIQQYGRESVIRKLLKERFEEFMSYPGTNMRDRILGLVSGYRHCKVCQKNILPYPRQDTLGLYCSKKCMQNDTDAVMKKIKKGRHTLKEKYGVENAMQVSSVREKFINTMRERYGVEHPSQVKEFHDRAVSSTDHQKLHEKTKHTMRERYGVEYAAKVPEFADKQIQTNLERYGAVNPLMNPEVNQKAKSTMLDRYGVSHALESAELLEKSRQTNLRNRGVEWPAQCEDVHKKAMSTNLERYGAVNPMQNEDVRNSVKETIKERYGVDHPMHHQEFRDKAIDVVKQNRVEYAKEVAVKFGLDPNKVTFGLSKGRTYSKEFMQVMMGESENINAVFDVYNQPHSYYVLRQLGYTFDGNVSQRHKSLIAILDSNKIKYTINDRTVISPLEIDVYIPGMKVGIEVNGSYWHDCDRIGLGYHKNKSIICKENGVKLIHLFDWDDINKTISSILPKKKLNARSCDVRLIDSSVADAFCQENHRQGMKSAPINVGLFHGGELMMVCTFGKPRFNRAYDWENIRLCTKIGYSVRGGFGKMLSFVKSHIKGKVITYSPIDKGYNTVYSKLGFDKIGETKPSYHWVLGDCHLSRYQTQKHRLPALLRERYNPDLSEYENMRLNGFLKVEDCGQEVFTLDIT